jgi:hypothetical protein
MAGGPQPHEVWAKRGGAWVDVPTAVLDEEAHAELA